MKRIAHLYRTNFFVALICDSIAFLAWATTIIFMNPNMAVALTV